MKEKLIAKRRRVRTTECPPSPYVGSRFIKEFWHKVSKSSIAWNERVFVNRSNRPWGFRPLDHIYSGFQSWHCLKTRMLVVERPHKLQWFVGSIPLSGYWLKTRMLVVERPHKVQWIVASIH